MKQLKVCVGQRGTELTSTRKEEKTHTNSNNCRIFCESNLYIFSCFELVNTKHWWPFSPFQWGRADPCRLCVETVTLPSQTFSSIPGIQLCSRIWERGHPMCDTTGRVTSLGSISCHMLQRYKPGRPGERVTRTQAKTDKLLAREQNASCRPDVGGGARG
jgi:hypothetical protein